jgi:uncharacterized SAM-binding protein YcdF (DUF218 family)
VQVRLPRGRGAQHAGTGAILGVLIAVTAHVLGVQQLIRIPDLALYLPAGVVGGLIGPTRLRPLLWIAATPLAVICLLVAYTPLVAVISKPMIRRDVLPSRVDAIAVLGRGLTSDGSMRSETLDRLLSGLTLAKKGVAPLMLVSRETKNFGGTSRSDSADQQEVLSLATTTVEVIFVDSVITTRVEAMRMAAIARSRGISTIAVVTSPLHTKRACGTFEAVGFKVICVPAVVRDSGLSAESNVEDRLRSFRSWLYELFATAEYRSNRWIR